MKKTSLSCTSDAFAALSQELLQQGKSLRFRAQGTSMYPLVRNDDILLLEPFQDGKIRVGDVVLFNSQTGDVVVHRVIRRRNTANGMQYKIQGDQAAQPDGWIPREKILGRLSVVERDRNRFEMDLLSVKILNRFAVMRSKSNFSRNGFSALFVRLVKKIPVFRKFLT